MRTIRIPCSRCNGRGTVALPAWATELLSSLAKSGSTAPQLADKLDVSPTAMINRLRTLERHGLVQAKPANGRKYLWSRL